MAAASELIRDIAGKDIFWIAFFQFLLFRPMLHILPVVRLTNSVMTFILGSILTISVLTLLLIMPLLVFDYLPMPREIEIRRAYLYGFFVGGLSTHALWWILMKLSLIKRRQD